MMCVEVPVKTLRDEIAQLEHVEGQYAELYAKGARDALRWLLDGGEAPSKTQGFPLFKKAA